MNVLLSGFCRSFFSGCIGIGFGQIAIVIDGEIVDITGESADNGKGAPPSILPVNIV